MPCLELRHAFGDAPVDDGLGFKHNPPVLGLRLEHITDGYANLLPHLSRNHHLVFVLDRYDCHDES